MKGRAGSFGAAIVAGLCAAALAPSTAAAGEVSLSTWYPDGCCGILQYDASLNSLVGVTPRIDPNQENRVTAKLSSDRRRATITDPGKLVYGGLHPEPGPELERCSFRFGEARCSAFYPEMADPVFSTVMVWLGNRNDVFEMTGGWSAWVDGEAGDDRIWGYAGRDSLDGGPGADRIFGGAGDDDIDWGPRPHAPYESMRGRDRLDGGPGRDLIGAPNAGDVVLARDGEADTIDCFRSEARVFADAVDEVIDCRNAAIG